MDKFNSPLLLISRVLLALIFVAAGVNKMGHYSDTVAYMQSMGVAGDFLPAVIALEVGGGLAMAGGFLALAVAGGGGWSIDAGIRGLSSGVQGSASSPP
jgi:putative oxidoreductase